MILAVGTHRSLFEIRETYYERYRFAHIFAEVERAPKRLQQQIAEIEGVAAVEPRIIGRVILDIEGLAMPASGRVVSLPENQADGQPVLNRLYLRLGRLPAAGSSDEVAINEAFANAHGFKPGMKLGAIINGQRREVTITGIVLSPEFIYAVSPGELMPDDRRFGVLWMPEAEAEAAFDMQGAFNSITLLLRRNARERQVIDRLDQLLDRYGGLGAYDRKDQQSHAFIDAELEQLKAMAVVLPPVFLIVAAFLINMTLQRLITLEREQIGLLKALGYRSRTIAIHYLKLVMVIAAVGLLIGLPLGIWFGRSITGIYTEFYHFPFLLFVNTPDIFILSILVAMAAAIAGALNAVRQVVQLPPAVAMAPPAPTKYGRLLGDGVLKRLPQTVTMIVRHLIRFPVRTGLSALGIAGGTALLVGSLSVIDSIDFMVDVTYFRTLNYDTSVEFTGIRERSIVQEMENLPGVLRVEPHRSVPVVMRNGHLMKRIAITGIPQDNQLRKLLSPDLQPLTLPDTGLAIAEKVAEILHLRRGDTVRVEVMEGRKRVLDLPVTAIMQGYLGLSVYMDLNGLNALMGDGNAVSGVAMAIDQKYENTLYEDLKRYPAVAGMSMLSASLKQFRETLAENINIIRTIYVLMAVVITFGVVYNSARINLSERGRELASLRVLGFTQAEVSFILLGELAIIVLIAIPPGWLLGLLLKWSIVQSLDNDLFRVPFHIERDKFFLAAGVSIIAATLSALIVRKRIDELDLIEVLKTRE
jgi:putative ABC transport system permease protein